MSGNTAGKGDTTTMAKILDGKAIAAEIRGEVKEKVEVLTGEGGRKPGLVAVLVGENPASKAYVGSKARASKQVGIEASTLKLSADITMEDLLARIHELNEDPTVDGILVQLPLPDHLPEKRVLAAVDPTKDVDGFHPENVGKMWIGEPCLTPATPSGIIQMLRRSEIPLSGMNAVVIGRSTIVGKPMAGLLLAENCTVTICHSRTKDLPGVCRQADLLVAAIGRPAFVGPEHVGEGAVVVDVGINRITDPSEVNRLYPGDEKRRATFEKRGSTLVGDVDYHRVAPKTTAITPVPGGVGPLTVAQLLVNTYEACCRRQGKKP